VTSLYFSYSSKNNSTIDHYEHIWGDAHITEQLLGLNFRISPDAFFQVNATAAEALYQKVIDMVKEADTEAPLTHVLDVCCGTGTIGLAVAKHCPGTTVLGIDNCQQAIEDAVHNTEANRVTNASFVCGLAEHALRSIVSPLEGRSNNVLAIVDPPRAGLHGDVVKVLRTEKSITRVIFVSCSPQQAMQNFMDLMRIPNKRRRGDPFRCVRAVPVDLFPQTKHCEMIVEFVRLTDEDINGSTDQVASVNGSTDLSVKQDADSTVDKNSAGETQENSNSSDEKETSERTVNGNELKSGGCVVERTGEDGPG